MDGPRQVTFRIRHDCPLATVSRELPGVAMRAWSGHRFEVVDLHIGARRFDEVATVVEDALAPVRMLRTRDGAMAVWHPPSDNQGSISRLLEKHDLMWLQPLRVEAGWEHYVAISFAGREQEALDVLRDSHETQVVRRDAMGPDDVAASLFLSLQPVLEAPTDKQAEALLAADEHGYYRSPRGATTKQVATSLGIGRSAFEERLRGAENRVMAELLPSLRYARR